MTKLRISTRFDKPAVYKDRVYYFVDEATICPNSKIKLPIAYKTHKWINDEATIDVSSYNELLAYYNKKGLSTPNF